MASSFLSKSLTLLPNAAALFSLMLQMTGIDQLIRPESALELWRFPSPSGEPTELHAAATTDAATNATTQRDLVHGLVRREGVRNIALGVVGIATYYHGDRKLLGCVVFCGCFTAFSDGLISRAVIRGEELRHWVFLPFMLGTAAGLLGWSE
ncbi:hypothetical protein PG984_006437 [Apiospora sp. TS-2023a]